MFIHIDDRRALGGQGHSRNALSVNLVMAPESLARLTESLRRETGRLQDKFRGLLAEAGLGSIESFRAVQPRVRLPLAAIAAKLNILREISNVLPYGEAMNLLTHHFHVHHVRGAPQACQDRVKDLMDAVDAGLDEAFSSGRTHATPTTQREGGTDADSQ